MIGSHNSLTYLPVRQWYLKPFKWTAKCQSKSIQDQYFTYDVRLFDIRIRFKNGEPVIAHGPIEFRGDVLSYIDELNMLSGNISVRNECVSHATIYVRLILESNKPMKDQEVQELLFQEFCEYCIHKYPNLVFFGGNRKYDWKVVYQFTEELQLQDMYSSTTSIFGGSKNSWIAKLDDFWPWLYARLHNKKNINSYKGFPKVLFIDYVNIR